MKIKCLFVVLFSACFFFTGSAQQNYYDFIWQEKLGITDEDANEIIPPIYEWKSYLLDYQSPFIVLHSHNDGSLIVHKTTGKQEKMDYISGSTLINISGKEYMYAYNGGSSFLMNNKDINERLKLPKIYADLYDRGDFILGITVDNYPETSVCDILTKDFKIIKTDISFDNIRDFETSENGYLYALEHNGETKIFDKDFKQLEDIPLIFDNTEKLINALEKKYNISIDNDSVIETLAPMDSIEFPFIDGDLQGKDFVYYIYKNNKGERISFFKFPIAGYEIYNNSFNNIVEIAKRGSNPRINIAGFHCDVNNKKVLLPEKYKKEIGIEMIEE